jgi:PadR family transcriptional regulator PadR
VRLTPTLERVLRVFVADITARHYGYDLMKAATLQSDTLYPMRARLEEDGMVSSQWEAQQPDGRPPRKYYQLTGEGIRVARLELARATQNVTPRTRGITRPSPGSAR